MLEPDVRRSFYRIIQTRTPATSGSMLIGGRATDLETLTFWLKSRVVRIKPTKSEALLAEGPTATKV